MADDDLLPRHEEISTSFETADLERTWQAADPDHTDPASLSGAELAAYEKWEGDTKAEWAESSRRVAQEYDRLNALGLGSATVRNVVAEPTLPRNFAVSDLWSKLRALSRPKDTDGDTMDVNALPEAWAAVRRNPRDLAGVLEAMRAAAAPSADGPAKQAYQKSAFSRQFEGYVSDAMDVNQTAHALAKYVDMIDRRNALVDQYNDSVRRLMFLNAQSDRLSVGADDIAANTTAGTNDATRAWADYYNVLTSGVREICLENLARAYRAAAFWCLSDIASFRDWVQGNPGAVTATALEAGFNGLQTALGAAIDAFHRTPGVFPEKPTGELADGWTAGGVLVVLTPEAHPWLFRQLRNTGGVADFEILPATNASPAPATLEAPCDAVRQVPITKPDAVDLSDSETEAEIANPFYDRANVRLTAVRPYVEGMSTTNNIHSVQIEHLGQERFQTVDDEPFPAPSQAGPYLNHDPATISFKYNASEYRFDPKLGFAAAALQHGADLEDGSLQFNEEAAEAGAKLPNCASYAPIGPFGVWRLRIDPNYNPGADLKTISRIIIDFRGYSDTFSPD